MAFHHAKLGPADGIYEVKISIGSPDNLVFWISLPVPIIKQSFVAAQFQAFDDYAQGTPIFWHVSNHGANAWAVVDISLAKIELPPLPDPPAKDGKCLDPADSAKLYDQNFFSDLINQCSMGCQGKNSCLQSCFGDHFSPGCSQCMIGFGNCLNSQCNICVQGNPGSEGPAPECLECVSAICTPQFAQCAGVEAPSG